MQLPRSSTHITNRKKIFSEILPWYYVSYRKTKAFRKGEKAAKIPKNKVLTKREQKQIEYLINKKNPILEAQKYLKFIEENPGTTYTNAAKYFGVSKARITQMLNLVHKLPKEIIDFISNIKNPELLSHFSERKLRPLTLMKSDKEKIERFEMLLKLLN